MHEILDILLSFSTLDKALLLVFSLAVLVQLCYWIYYLLILRFHIPNEPVKSDKVPLVSVIVVVNQSHIDWIENDMRELFAQNHPNYEVVVVNDCGGEDVTLSLQRLSIENPILRYTSIQKDIKFVHTRKLALLVGIKCAKNKNLIFVEPWTKPSSDKWLRKMSEGFMNGKEVVIGASSFAYDNEHKRKLIRSFSLMSLIRYFRAALSSHPYKASSTNFGFTKDLFFKHGGYNYLSSSYGDNDLFLQEIVDEDNYSVVIDADCMVIRAPESSFKEWYRNQKFKTSTFRFYPFTVKLSIFFELLSSFVMWAFFLCSLVKTFLLVVDGTISFDFGSKYFTVWTIILSLIIVRQIVLATTVSLIAKRLKEKELVYSFICYEKIAAMYEAVLSVTRRFGEAKNIW